MGVRIDVGGKLLTNHLKDLISFRQWNMMDQTYVVNSVREACGLVSLDYRKDLDAVKWGSHPTRLWPFGQWGLLADLFTDGIRRRTT